jgi:hypothetical protein
MSKIRMEKRRKVIDFTPVLDVHTNTSLGYLDDLTQKGALMVSEKPVESGQALTVAIEFRDSPNKPPSKHMIVSARVAWCKPEKHHTYYKVGLEFVDMLEQNMQMIEAILLKYEFSARRPK